MTDHFHAPPPRPAPPGDLDELKAALGCLCGNISGLRADLKANASALSLLSEQLGLLRNRLERIDGRLDALEEWAVDHLPDYPQRRRGDQIMTGIPMLARRTG